MLAHILSGGVIFPLGYILLSSQALSGPPVLQGVLWAGLLWFVAEVIMAPMQGAEVFSIALGGLPAALRALLGYLVYGATLGSIVGTVQPEDRYASHTL
jgi:tetrahydromethanopterin S-methyltransferase subunit E